MEGIRRVFLDIDRKLVQIGLGARMSYLQQTEDYLPADVVLVQGEEAGFEELETTACNVIVVVQIFACTWPLEKILASSGPQIQKKNPHTLVAGREGEI